MGKRLYIFLSAENSIILAFSSAMPAIFTKIKVPVLEVMPTESLFADGIAQRIPAKCPPGKAPSGMFIVKSIFFLSFDFKVTVFSLTSIQLESLEGSFLSAIGKKFGVPFSFNGLKSLTSATRVIGAEVSLKSLTTSVIVSPLLAINSIVGGEIVRAKEEIGKKPASAIRSRIFIIVFFIQFILSLRAQTF